MRNKFLIFINLLITNFIFAQLLELPKSILSPNAASLGKYGDISMDLNTGRANVNIPLYSFPFNVSKYSFNALIYISLNFIVASFVIIGTLPLYSFDINFL